jgi:acyl-CoA hydrolase
VRECTKAYFTFVAIDKDGKPIPVPEVVPEDENDRRRYEKAALRRQIRLLNKG